MENTSESKPKSRRSRSSGLNMKVQKKFTPRKRHETESDNSCVLCAQEITIFAIGFCDHPICMRCSAKMRIVCEQTECSVCRKDLKQLIYSKNCDKFSVLESFQLKKDLHHRGVFFTSINLRDEYSKLFLNTCTVCENNHTETSFNDLQRHMRKEHDLHYCDLCVKHTSNLVDEMKSYSRKDLGLHRRVGDEDDTSHKGHPNCEFCDERYYDNDALLKHLRTDHYFCHICDKDGGNQYYDKYINLREHFRADHFLCEDGNCAQEEFTGVFKTELDFKAHRAKEHGDNLTRQQQRAERNLTSADLGFQYSQPRGAKGKGRSYSSRRQEEQFAGRNDDPELAQAIAISLQVQDPQNGRRYRVERPQDRQKKPVEQHPQQVDVTKMDFPTLTGDGTDTATANPPISVTETESKKAPAQTENASTATVVAFAAGISTGNNRYNENDFPALGGETKTNANTRWGSTASISTKPMSVNVPERKFPGKKVNFSKESDFPTLGGPSKNSTNNAFWGNVVTVPKVKKKPMMVTITPKQNVPNNQSYRHSNRNVPKAVSDNTYPTYNNNVTAPVRIGSNKRVTYLSVKKSSAEIEDIEKPTEIPGVMQGTNVKTITPDAFSMMSGQQIHGSQNQNYFVQDSDFPSLGGNVKPKGPFASALTQKTTKKEKNTSKSNPAISLAALSNDIAAETKPKAKSSQLQQSNKNRNITSGEDDENRVIPSNWESELNSFSADCNVSKVNKSNQLPIMVADREKNKHTYVMEKEEFPSLAPIALPTATKTKNRKKKKKKSEQTVEDINKHFPKSFVQIESSNGSAIANIENSIEKTTLSLSSVFASTSDPKPSTATETSTNTKRLPPGISKKPSDGDTNAKNMWLIQTVQLLCKDEELFTFFKSCSGRFRTGEITAKEYYNDCVNILGRDNFMAISSELVELLPEENKRKELLREISIT